MTFVETILAWWLIIGVYYVLDTFMQDFDEKPGYITLVSLVRNIILLPIMPLMVVISLMFRNITMIGIENETEE